ncbi:MAG: 16S rRNA (cytosine(967)-C(5))-methyltransferase RsmB [Lachnospiraceae bacterium]|nr:16S rRNA (cytosine(967)-C(5))-methyltransferase RsmB [Lachnospiraceae bacterium]
METDRNARNTALTILCRIFEDKVPSHIALSTVNSSTSDDRAFIKRLVTGTVERVITIDKIIERYSSVKPEKQKPVIRNVLRMGIFQILFMNVPDSAACNEAVKLVKKRGMGGLSGFVNGILRKICSQKDILIKETDIQSSDTQLPDIQSLDIPALSFKYSLPEWIVRLFIDRFGFTKAITAFGYFLKESSLQIRCNISRTDPDVLEGMLTGCGVSVKRINDKCMVISDIDRLETLEPFKKGLFMIQDLSSVLAGENPSAELLREYIKDRSSDLKVLDLCAAPGGKTLNMADRLKVEGFKAHFTACDISQSKLEKIRENIERCRFDDIECRLSDATVFNEDFSDEFDIVIADVPCSGLGVIGRKPDIKLNASPEGIEELNILQKDILKNAVRYVKAGGFIVFSTCTVVGSENEDNVRFIEDAGFERINAVQICPGEYECDGFFYSLLRKR